MDEPADTIASVILHLWGKPGDELGENGDEPITAARLTRFRAELDQRLARAVQALAILEEDGWEATLQLYDIELSHPEIRTEEGARLRLQSLGLDPEDFFIEEFEVEGEDWSEDGPEFAPDEDEP